MPDTIIDLDVMDLDISLSDVEDVTDEVGEVQPGKHCLPRSCVHDGNKLCGIDFAIANVASHYRDVEKRADWAHHAATVLNCSRQRVWQAAQRVREPPNRRKTRSPEELPDELLQRLRVDVHERIARRELVFLEDLPALWQNQFPGEYTFKSVILATRFAKQMGFRVRKLKNQTVELYRNPGIVSLRAKYWQALDECRAEGREIFFQDEVNLRPEETPTRGLVDIFANRDADVLADPSNPLASSYPKSGKGHGRVNILGIVSESSGLPDGWYSIADGTGHYEDYHRELDTDSYKAFLEKCVVNNPEVPDKCALVIDNAGAHNKRIPETLIPIGRTGETTDVMINWLSTRGLSLPAANGRRKTGPRKGEPIYARKTVQNHMRAFAAEHGHKYEKRVIDDFIANNGKKDIRLIRLPPRHPKLNAIEFLWAPLIEKTKRRNLTGKGRMADLRPRVDGAIADLMKKPEEVMSWIKGARSEEQRMRVWDAKFLERSHSSAVVESNEDAILDQTFELEGRDIMVLDVEPERQSPGPSTS